MIEYAHELGTVVFLEPGDDTTPVHDLLSSRAPISVDTETTSYHPFAPDFTVRLVQIGSADAAYVFRPQDFPEMVAACVTTRPFFGHNATFDGLALERSCGIAFADFARYAVDTGILSRLHDSRGQKESQPGHTLDALTKQHLGIDSKSRAQRELIAAATRHVHRDIPKEEKGMSKERKAEIAKLKRECVKVTKDNVWTLISDTDPTYHLYAGQDVLCTARLGVLLLDKIKADGLGWLSEFEHRVAYCCASIQRKGMPVDLEWIAAGREKYRAAYEAAEATLRDVYGVVKGKDAKSYSNATASLLERLRGLGAVLTKLTDGGNLSLDAGVLKDLVRQGGEAAGLAQTVLDAKQADHYGGYLDAFVKARGYDGRVHAKINPMEAVTGRMSITDPPLQQLPRKDVTMRGSFVPDEGHVLISADYSQVEWRVAAAVTKDPTLLAAIHNGQDIHNITATAVFGPEFTPDERTTSKTIGLGILYGSGENGLVKTQGLTPADAKRIRNTILNTYPGIKRIMDLAKKKIQSNGNAATEFRTQTGRKLVLESGHKVLNYFCQSQARDLFAEAVVKMFDAGLGDNVRLLVHDEVVLSVPAAEVDSACKIVNDCMNTTFLGVPITAEAEILGDGTRWTK
jgi:DNA polymerase-1